MHKLENQSYIDYKVTKKDYFMGCPTMLTSDPGREQCCKTCLATLNKINAL